MLRIISSKLAQRTPGDLSIQDTNQQVLQPYSTMTNFIRNEWKKRQQNKLQMQRNRANGSCPNCSQFLARDKRGRPFCPSCKSRR